MNRYIKLYGIAIDYGDAEITFLNVSLNGKSPYTKASSLYLHQHGYYELHFVSKGKEIFVDYNKETELNSKELFIILPGSKHYTGTLDAVESFVLSFKVDKKNGRKGFYDYFIRTLENNASKSIRVSEELCLHVAELEGCFEDMSIETHCRLKSKITEILYLMFKDINNYSINGNKAKCAEGKSEFLLILDTVINDESYNLNSIAELTGYSTRNLARLIKNTYGESFTQLRRKRRFLLAKNLLEDPTRSIEQIALDSGFKNVTALRSAFKEYESITPSQYKRLFDRDL